MGRIRGTLAAAVTPLRDGGDAVDEAGIGPLTDFFVRGGLDGILALGTTGEGIMLSVEERRVVAERFLEASSGRLTVAVHCGAQTTSDTVRLAAHAAEAGADAVAVIAPPYFAFDEAGLLAHFGSAAGACDPVPFYVYEFAARSGYAVPVPVLERLRAAPNFAGMKVSDAPWERFEPYLLDGLDVFVGPEALIVPGLERGAVGAVSGLATAFPELVSNLVHNPTPEKGDRVAAVRTAFQELPFHSAMKFVLSRRGVPIELHVRAPLRALTADERATAERLLGEVEGSIGQSRGPTRPNT